jgi:hypothetical protein
MLAYEGFSSGLCRYAKPGTGPGLKATVYIPWQNPKEQALSLFFSKESVVHFQMPEGQQIASDWGEIDWLYMRAQSSYQRLLKPHGIEFYFAAWLSGNLFRPTLERMREFGSDCNEDGLMFAVRTLSVDPFTAGLPIPAGISWNDWVIHGLGDKRNVIQRYAQERREFITEKLSERMHEPVPA